MTKHSTTLPTEDKDGKFDVKVSYEISAGKKITITKVEDDGGKPWELSAKEKKALAEKLTSLHPDHELPPELPAVKPPVAGTLPGDDLVGGQPDNSLPTDPIPDQILPGVPGTPEQGLPDAPGTKPVDPKPPVVDNSLPDLSLPKGARCPTCGQLMVPEPK